jgi:hypothetical protein
MEGILKERRPGHRQLDMRGERVGLAQVAELVQLPPEGPLVLGRHAVSTLGAAPRVAGAAAAGAAGARILEGGGARVVVHKISHSVLRIPVTRICRTFKMSHQRDRSSIYSYIRVYVYLYCVCMGVYIYMYLCIYVYTVYIYIYKYIYVDIHDSIRTVVDLFVNLFISYLL